MDQTICLVGAGLSGLTLALALSKADFAVTLLDPAGFQLSSEATKVDRRTLALSPAGQKLLTGLGLWEDVKDAACPVDSMLIAADSNETLRFSSSDLEADDELAGSPNVDLAEQPLAHILYNHVLKQSLLHHCKLQDNIALRSDFRLKNIDRLTPGDSMDRWRLESEDGREQCACLLLACDGQNSLTRRLFSIPMHRKNYRQTAVVCEVELRDAHQGQAYQNFASTGPIALLPLPLQLPFNQDALEVEQKPQNHDQSTRTSLIWSYEHRLAKELKDLNEVDFLDILNMSLGPQAPEVIKVGTRQSFNLHAGIAQRLVKPGLALLAEAAHTVHPLAGQGFNLSLGDIKVLVEVLGEARRSGQDLASLSVLETYADRRHQEVSLMFAGIDQLNQLLSSPLRLPKILRNVGFAALDKAAPFKRRLVQQTMGLKH